MYLCSAQCDLWAFSCRRVSARRRAASKKLKHLTQQSTETEEDVEEEEEEEEEEAEDEEGDDQTVEPDESIGGRLDVSSREVTVCDAACDDLSARPSPDWHIMASLGLDSQPISNISIGHSAHT